MRASFACLYVCTDFDAIEVADEMTSDSVLHYSVIVKTLVAVDR